MNNIVSNKPSLALCTIVRSVISVYHQQSGQNSELAGTPGRTDVPVLPPTHYKVNGAIYPNKFAFGFLPFFLIFVHGSLARVEH